MSHTSVVEELDVLIVGSGPAGAATGMALMDLAPDIGRKSLCIDKATHPREKICGGGLTGQMIQQLEQFGVDLSGVPAVSIQRCVASYRTIHHTVELENEFKVIRRDAHDAKLAQTMVERGMRLREGVSYQGYERREDGRLNVSTSDGIYVVKALVAADGAGSKIARSIGDKKRAKVHLAQIDLPMPEGVDPNAMVYDFSRVTDNLWGYVWVFPTPIYNDLGRQMCNVGLMQWGSTRAGGGMPELLAGELKRFGFDLGNQRIKFHPEWPFDPKYCFSAPNILTVGDAAGIDPLFGEGLSQCMEYGTLAAAELANSLPANDLSFSGYRKRVLKSPVGRELRVLRWPARTLYRPGNTIWTSFIFNGTYLPKLMADQGQGKTLLQKKLVTIMVRALWHYVFGNKNLPS